MATIQKWRNVELAVQRRGSEYHRSNVDRQYAMALSR
jgi:hypothetical protein